MSMPRLNDMLRCNRKSGNTAEGKASPLKPNDKVLNRSFVSEILDVAWRSNASGIWLCLYTPLSLTEILVNRNLYTNFNALASHQCIFYKFFNNRGWTLHNFTRCNLVGNEFWEYLNVRCLFHESTIPYIFIKNYEWDCLLRKRLFVSIIKKNRKEI